MDFVFHMQARFGTAFREHEPLARHLNIRIGGPSRYFVEVKTCDDVRDVLTVAREYKIPYFILGGGSNTLVADAGWDGLVIKMTNRDIRIEGTKVIASAGAISALVARKAAEAGLRGFSWAISLPGTMGGAVRGNAGCFGGEMKDTVVSVQVIREKELVEISARDLCFAYRDSVFKHDAHRDEVIFSVTMELAPGSRDEELALLDKYLASRKASQPLGSSSAGCMFKNYEFVSDDDVVQMQSHAEIPSTMLAKRHIPAGWIVEQLGLKGLQVGSAQVSDVHGNFLLNKGHATAKDIAELIGIIKKNAQEKYGIVLHEEVQFLGF